MIDDLMIKFVEQLTDYFNTRLSAFECFCKHGIQVEGWLKGELLLFLEEKKLNDNIIGFDREVNMGLGRKKVDFTLKVKEKNKTSVVWIELKNWLIGYQKGTRWKANSYFGDASSVGIKPDVEKLSRLSENRFLLILATANPGEIDWESGIQKFNSKFKPLKVKSLTSPKDFPSTYFLGLLKVIESS